MNKVLIITGGDIDFEFGYKFVRKKEYNLIIAVDGGLSFVKKAGLKPDYIIGDFDTVSANILAEYENTNSKIIRLNPIKDSTDTEEAVDLAIKSKASDIYILGGIGSRLDHSIGNLFLIKKALKSGVNATIYTKNSKIFMIDKPTKIINDKKYKYISFIQFDKPALGVTLRNFKYCVENFDFDTDKTYRLGVSNELLEDYGEVDIKSGELLVIFTND